MEQKNKEDPKEKMFNRLQRYYIIARFLFIMLLVVALGVFTINQVLQYNYKAEFLKAPCELCKELNKNQSLCIDECFKYSIQTFLDPYGNLKDLYGRCYDLSGKEIKCLGYDP